MSAALLGNSPGWALTTAFRHKDISCFGSPALEVCDEFRLLMEKWGQQRGKKETKDGLGEHQNCWKFYLEYLLDRERSNPNHWPCM